MKLSPFFQGVFAGIKHRVDLLDGDVNGTTMYLNDLKKKGTIVDYRLVVDEGENKDDIVVDVWVKPAKPMAYISLDLSLRDPKSVFESPLLPQQERLYDMLVNGNFSDKSPETEIK